MQKKHSDVYGIRINPVEDSTPPKRQKAKTPDLKAYNTDKIAEMLECLDRNNDIALKTAVMIALFDNEKTDGMLKYIQIYADGIKEGI